MSQAGPQPPLFERLSSQTESLRALDQDALAESVRCELGRLLNTRRATRAKGAALSVIDYGIADWSALQSLREEDRRTLLREIRLAIQVFEPRLQLSELDIQTPHGQPQRLLIRLGGMLRAGQQHWPAVFVIDNAAEGIEVRHERLD
ncbi:MAG: type VI secretion system baseplate subunit TssE [Gammaproteobacteria bacterium]|nr:type VI secretion system baseplate subunit TssE [Gammaproteobacteria bacterium]MBU1489811.1 type VI secretion system baseplate subunit TssE [Gammaproteobacteria bacterium]MBU2067730.1 type VI secretion system baseplate subunit TssE [Gammaproteobacteria bacterium]MBU2140913.1 type VI secretion system baseplate subunit TssE [Gammaproteobacteria bacterium]MBU2218415.1 type VI secretion system baseplate subunit TssE [Gammaproteobacteria bacterium]